MQSHSIMAEQIRFYSDQELTQVERALCLSVTDDLRRRHPSVLMQRSTAGNNYICDGDGENAKVRATPVPFTRHEIFS